MNIAEIESELQDHVDRPFDAETFVFRFLEIYDAPKATITKLKQGSGNHANETGDILWKNKLFFRAAKKGQAAKTVDTMLSDPLVKKHRPRFAFSTDGEDVYCCDLKTDQAIDVSYKKLNDHFLFFLPLANIERYEVPAENPADIKATGRVAKLYDAILEANGDWIERDYTHDLNQFMTRLLFCLFSEDTSIFEKDIFTSTLMNMTQEDGSDTTAVLDLIFESMNTKPEERGNLPEYAKRFPYVNGGLFRDKTQVPKFSKRARRLLQECGELNWSDINPDIFGSMIQAVAQPGLREDMGMHYTSVPNIMKVLHPLFLLDLEEDFEAAKDSEPKLTKLLQRLYKIRIFDPACGSGNFLIIAYKELRKLEMRIFERQKHIAQQWSLPMTEVKLTNFCGIELTDFAAETAKLSLWIAEYQMNDVFKTIFGKAPPALPLRDSGNIVHGNATRINWADVCEKTEGAEIYIVGNPPYAGSVIQSVAQKEDMQIVFEPYLKNYKDLDYVASWYLKAASYCRAANAKSALVSTNSICQGEQVAMLWPLIFDNQLEIGFAHQSFKWRNSAANNAGVTCVIAGLRCPSNSKKLLFSGEVVKRVRNIGPYLIESDNTIVSKRARPISSLPRMELGNKPTDGGHFFLTRPERDELLSRHPEASPLIRRFCGSQEFIQGIERWCLWIENENAELAASIDPIRIRVEAIRKLRMQGNSKQALQNAATPHRFVYAPHKPGTAIVVPSVSSERRSHLAVGLVSDDVIIGNRAYAIYGAPEYAFSILSSYIHYLWAMTVGGRLETRISYSNTVVYNTFPMPELSESQMLALEDHAVEILAAREAHVGKTIAWLYDPDTIPQDLKDAHRELDNTIETIYIGRPFKNDAERLEHLFRLYETMAKKERVKENRGKR